jgi:hypothetical protein
MASHRHKSPMSSYFAHSTHLVGPRPFGPLVPVPGRTLFALPIGSPHGGVSEAGSGFCDWPV